MCNVDTSRRGLLQGACDEPRLGGAVWDCIGAVWDCVGLYRALWGCVGLYWGCMGVSFWPLWSPMLVVMVLYIGGKASRGGGRVSPTGLLCGIHGTLKGLSCGSHVTPMWLSEPLSWALMWLSWGFHGGSRGARMGFSWGSHEASVWLSWGFRGAAMGLLWGCARDCHECGASAAPGGAAMGLLCGFYGPLMWVVWECWYIGSIFGVVPV